MRKTRLVVLLIIGIFFLSVTIIAEEITLTTYYPAPYGEYQQLYVSGNVGIGTTITEQVLHIVASNPRIRIDNTAGNNWAIGSNNLNDFSIWENPLTDVRLTIKSGGNVGIGTTTVRQKLDVIGSGIFTGNVGIGTTSPQTKLHVYSTGGAYATHTLRLQRDSGDAHAGIWDMKSVIGGIFTIEDVINGAKPFYIFKGAPNGSFTISDSGNVGIGTTSPTAKLHVWGNIKAILNDISGGAPVNMRYNSGTNEIGYDVAELFEANEEVEPGDVLSIDEKGNLKRSTEAYDMKVAGIVSEAPAILFEGNQLQIAPQPFTFQRGKKPPLALAGRALCKVTTQGGGPIKRGDLLVTSSKPGYAMRARHENVRIGTVLGKALEPLDKGDGKIMVLVTLQ